MAVIVNVLDRSCLLYADRKREPAPAARQRPVIASADRRDPEVHVWLNIRHLRGRADSLELGSLSGRPEITVV